MPDLTEFLLARIVEDQYAASVNSLADTDPLPAEVDGLTVYRAAPARRSAECEAKRRIVLEVVPRLDGMDAEQLLRLLALPYADHPDYELDWKP